MRGSRLLIIIGFVVLVGAVAVYVVMFVLPPDEKPVVEGTPVTPFIPEGMKEVVVAAQNIPRGTSITSDTVQAKFWPIDSVFEGTMSDVEEVLGLNASVDIRRGMPLMIDMLTEEPVRVDLPEIPAGKVAYALPVSRYSSVAWALRPGDHVDVLISLLVVDLDEEFQTLLPNQAGCISPSEEEGCKPGILGRLEVLPNDWVVSVGPNNELQRPRLVTQLTVQNAVVLRVGDWPSEEEEEEEVPLDEGGEPVEPVEPVPGEEAVPPERANIEPLTLIVTLQDAMVLKYAEEIGASIDLVLRSPDDSDIGRITTESVTLQYIFDRFSIELPPSLPYGVTPPVRSLRPNYPWGRGGSSSEKLPEEMFVEAE